MDKKPAYEDLEKRVRELERAVTEQKKNEEAETENKRYVKTLFDAVHTGIMIVDPRTQEILDVNNYLSELVGIPREKILGRKTGEYLYPAKEEENPIADANAVDPVMERRLMKATGEMVPVLRKVVTVGEKGRERLVESLVDISRFKREQEYLLHNMFHDPLTGLPNRQLFFDRLERAMAYSRRNKEMLAVLFLDMDHFKDINDSLGHPAGDAFLREVVKRLKGICRDEDTISRFGGDEFMIIQLDVKSSRGAIELARRITEGFSQPILFQGHELFASSSIGITLYPYDGHDAETLVRNADMAMYKAKEQGKKKYVMYTKDMNVEVVRRIALEGSLRKALEREEFRVYYQPTVDLGTGRVSGIEALVRWRRSEKELILPKEFVPLADDMGLILPLGEWLLRKACRQTRLRQEKGFPRLSLAVNLSAKQFQSEGLILLVQDVLRETGLAPEFLNLEITENTVMVDVEAAVDTMAKLAEMGIRISIDDFGTGYFSLSHLKRFPLNVLKIDRSFVREIPDNPDDMAIAKSIISLARSLNLKVIAEGVETSSQLKFMRSHGCDEIQGFFFSRPLSARGLTRFLKQGRTLPLA
jgi:diguanylate cyclase (GGDEF)-like protein/PAS domain S-box-containing protein